MNHAKKLLKEIGLEPERIEMYNIGASDAVKFVSACKEMVDRARKLGPNPLKAKNGVLV